LLKTGRFPPVNPLRALALKCGNSISPVRRGFCLCFTEGRQRDFVLPPPPSPFPPIHLDKDSDNLYLMNDKTVVLIDSGYFVGRQKKHWSPRGSMKKNYRLWKSKKLNWFEYQYRFQKAVKGDLTYCEVVMSRMKSNPKYDKTCEAILCFDGIKGRQLRGSIYEEYKSSRNGGLEVKASEHEGKDTRNIFTNVGIDIDKDLPIRWSYRYEESKEADDLIAELTMEYLMKDYKVIILSADTDLFQMLRYPNVRIHNFRKEITNETVVEMTGVSPHQYADWKSLVGDASDSIPGVPNLGKSKTTKLLQKHDKLEEIPLDEFRVYYAKSPVELANKTRQIREENGWSISKCKKEYGSAWVSLENGDDVKMNSEQVRKLTQAFDISGYLIFDDYYNKALMWKRLVRLPFGDGQSEMPKSVN